MAQTVLRELLRQIDDGYDIPKARKLLSRIKPEDAAKKLPNMPYSLITNLAHTLFWQRFWLNRLGGLPGESFTNDWRVPVASQWESLCAEFLDGFEKARSIASSRTIKHKMKNDEEAVKTLLQIAVHNSYHLGQMNLLKRALRLSKKG